MKLIIIEGTDRTGKSTLLKKLCEYYNYDNVTIRHFGKPKVTHGTNVKSLQRAIFKFECELLKRIHDIEILENKNYYENVVIWNRSHFGEYVYGQMYRDYTNEEATEVIKDIDFILKHLNIDIQVVHLYGDINVLMKNEDGDSLSKTIDDKKKEIDLFFDVFYNKTNFIVNHVNVTDKNTYRSASDIFNDVLTNQL